MVNTSPKSGIENYSKDKIVEVVQINSLKDLKENLWVEKLEWIEEEFKKPLITSKQELLKMKEELTAGETSMKLRELLENKWVIWIVGEKFKRATDNFKENFKPKEIAEASSDWIEEISTKLEKSFDNVKNTEVWTQAKEALTIVKEKAKETWVWFSWKKLENLPYIWWFFKIIWELFWWLKWIFWFGEKTKDGIDKAKKVLDPTTPEYKETLNQTQNTVISYLEKTTWEKFDDATKNRLKTKLSPNIKWSYISTENFEELTEKIKSWKKLTINDLKDSWVILNIMKDPDFREIKELLSSNINKKLFTFFKSKFERSWVTFNPENEWKLKWIIRKEFETTTINKLVERTKENWWEVHFDWLEWIESILWVWVLIPNIIFEAYKENIIKAENLAIWVVESWKDTISIWLKALDWQDIIPDLIWRMNWNNFDEKLLNVTPEKKLLLERAFYAELWIVSSVLGTIWFYWTSSLISLIESWANKIEWKWFKTPNINRLEKTLNIIWEWKWTW